MKIGKLTETDARAILRGGSLGRLGCIASGWPYVVPVNYFFDGEDIYVHSLPGKKIDALRENPPSYEDQGTTYRAYCADRR